MDIYLQTITSPLGDLKAAATDKGICLLEFHDRRILEMQKEKLLHFYEGTFIEKYHPHLSLLGLQLKEYFEGTRFHFDIPMSYPGSIFQKKVWESLLQIPYGQTRTYAKQAELLGDKKAIRAVAKANGENRLAIIIPCHRVIGSNGEMTGYSGNIWRKKKLLELEGAISRQGELF